MEGASKPFVYDKMTVISILLYFDHMVRFLNQVHAFFQLFLHKTFYQDFLFYGRAVIILKYSKEKEALFQSYEKLASPAHLIALPCETEEKERELTSVLLAHNMDYTRSTTDIEMIYTNAKKRAEIRTSSGSDSNHLVQISHKL